MFQNLKRAGILASSLFPFYSAKESAVPTTFSEEAPPRSNLRLALHWADGMQDIHELPQTGEITIGNVVIRRARVRYFLERIDNAFPAMLNGQSIGKSHILHDGDVLQIDELQTTFQLSA